MEEYPVLREMLRGVHVAAGGKEAHWPQYEEFCDELSIFCDHFARRSDIPQERDLDPETYARIADINRIVDENLIPVEDQKLYGISDKWTIPDIAGDCEDSVLLKMLRLTYADIDPSRLHILVVQRKDTQEGHAVLGIDVLVDGKRNTIILDNLTPKKILSLEQMEKKYGGIYSSFVIEVEGERKVRFFEYKTATQ